MRVYSTIAMITYLVLLHVVIGVLLSGRGRRLVPALSSQDQSLKRDYFQSQMTTFHRRIDEMAQPRSVIFIGASEIQGIDVGQICDRALNFGIGGDTTEGVLRRLPVYASLATARAVVLSIGYNDLGRTHNQDVLFNIETILERIPSDLPVFLCPITMVDENLIKHVNNDRIGEFNQALSKLGRRFDNVVFVEVSQELSGKELSSKTRILEKDGCHLNLQGRRIWSEAVRKLLLLEEGNYFR